MWDDYDIRIIRWDGNGSRHYQREVDNKLCERFLKRWKVKTIAVSLHMLHSDVGSNPGLEQGTTVGAAKKIDSAVVLSNHDVEI